MRRSLERSPLLADDAWRYAILVGLASIPVTVVLYRRSSNGDAYSIVPVFFAGLLVGALSERREMDERRVGVRTGFVGSVPFLWPVFDLLAFIFGLTQPLWASGVQIVMLVFVAAVVVGFSAVVGMVGAIVGHWLIATVRTETTALLKVGIAFSCVFVLVLSVGFVVGAPPGREPTLTYFLSRAVGWGGVCAVVVYVITKQN